VFVAAGDQLEEEVRGVLFKRDVADFVDHDEPDAAQLDQFSGQPAGGVGCFEAGDPVDGGGERDAVPGVGGFDGQACPFRS
jgi:hypothetical protein